MWGAQHEQVNKWTLPTIEILKVTQETDRIAAQD